MGNYYEWDNNWPPELKEAMTELRRINYTIDNLEARVKRADDYEELNRLIEDLQFFTEQLDTFAHRVCDLRIRYNTDYLKNRKKWGIS